MPDLGRMAVDALLPHVAAPGVAGEDDVWAYPLDKAGGARFARRREHGAALGMQ
jgi:hypothetical protein